MTTAIPKHMSSLQIHGGLPVPCVVKTRDGHASLDPSDWKGADLQTVWVPKGDIPDFAKYDDEKHRKCIVEEWCHVCARPKSQVPLMLCLPKHDKPTDGQMIEVNKRMVPMVLQPWVCAECLLFACTHCPPLRRAIEERRGSVAFVKQHRLVMTYWKPNDPGDPAPAPGLKVVSLFKLAIVEARYEALFKWAARWKSK